MSPSHRPAPAPPRAPQASRYRRVGHAPAGGCAAPHARSGAHAGARRRDREETVDGRGERGGIVGGDVHAPSGPTPRAGSGCRRARARNRQARPPARRGQTARSAPARRRPRRGAEPVQDARPRSSSPVSSDPRHLAGADRHTRPSIAWRGGARRRADVLGRVPQTADRHRQAARAPGQAPRRRPLGITRDPPGSP